MGRASRYMRTVVPILLAAAFVLLVTLSIYKIFQSGWSQ